MNKDRVIWCNSWKLPHAYGFCPNEAAWNHMCKYVKLNPKPYPTSPGATSLFVARGGSRLPTAVVTVQDRPPLETVNLLVHEAMHVWRDMRKTIGEKKPSSEFEAYSMMIITDELMRAYEQTRGRLFIKRRP